MQEDVIKSTASNKGEYGRQEGRQSIERPWLNTHGDLKSDEEIKDICGQWSASTWDEYLRFIGCDVEPQEKFLKEGHDIENVGEEAGLSYIFLTPDHQEYPHLKESIRAALQRLSPNERKVIELIFWERKSQRESAEILGISRRTIRSRLDRSLIKLKEIMEDPRLRDNLIYLQRYKKLKDRAI